jgi:hypothetical protein
MSDTTIRKMISFMDGLRSAADHTEALIGRCRTAGASAEMLADLQAHHALIVRPLADDDHDLFLLCGPIDGVHREGIPTFRSAA